MKGLTIKESFANIAGAMAAFGPSKFVLKKTTPIQTIAYGVQATIYALTMAIVWLVTALSAFKVDSDAPVLATYWNKFNQSLT